MFLLPPYYRNTAATLIQRASRISPKASTLYRGTSPCIYSSHRTYTNHATPPPAIFLVDPPSKTRRARPCLLSPLTAESDSARHRLALYLSSSAPTAARCMAPPCLPGLQIARNSAPCSLPPWPVLRRPAFAFIWLKVLSASTVPCPLRCPFRDAGALELG